MMLYFYNRWGAYTAEMPTRKNLLATFQDRLAKVIHDSKLNRSQFAEAVGLDR